LILTTGGEKISALLIGREFDAGDVLGVTSVFLGGVTLEKWIIVDANEAIIVTRREELAVLGHGARVDVGAVASGWEDTLDAPSELASVIGPDSLDGVGSTRWISLLVLDVEEKELVSTTDTSEIGTVNGEVQGGNEGTVTGELGTLLI